MRHESHFEDSIGSVVKNLAAVLRLTMRKIDKVLRRPAYNFVVHSAPVQENVAGVLSLAPCNHSKY